MKNSKSLLRSFMENSIHLFVFQHLRLAKLGSKKGKKSVKSAAGQALHALWSSLQRTRAHGGKCWALRLADLWKGNFLNNRWMALTYNIILHSMVFHSSVVGRGKLLSVQWVVRGVEAAYLTCTLKGKTCTTDTYAATHIECNHQQHINKTPAAFLTTSATQPFL